MNCVICTGPSHTEAIPLIGTLMSPIVVCDACGFTSAFCVCKPITATNVFTGEQETYVLTLKDRLRLKRRHVLEIGARTQPGWSGSLQFYLFECLKCGKPHIDYLHGWGEPDDRTGFNCVSDVNPSTSKT